MEISEDVHWRDVYEGSGKVTSMPMGGKRVGKMVIDKSLLCIEKEPSNCYEVWIAGKNVNLQRGAILPLEDVIGPPSCRDKSW